MSYYRLKVAPEAVWFVVVAAVVALMQVLIEFDAALIEDWRFWFISVGSGLVRAVAAAILVSVGKGQLETSGDENGNRLDLP